ncbi:ATP-binding protein [Actinosynnema sp. NPDC047251]|uniref:Putative AAA ATPase n=1 Tax=Saccharothrix espanaensis (strain ATCC 51144 / DSM 44229 / JCM 9112 / NBRC 15066 / NRRL 15764) TaxID=1179773 RepID=K0JUA1_SACES|nr:ATP-binding protein [Saccharothrix espanaensis]CCH28389.1 putative AAA ATPase [Saccharothrix espanaensis DSM 44229]
MTEQQRKALATLRFNSAETPDDVWQTSPFHVDGLHVKAEDRIRAGIADAKASTGPSPIGLVLQGRKGVGKTHLLGSVRRVVQREGGYFFLVELTTGAEFWNDVAEAMRSELRRTTDDGELQLTVLLRQLCDAAGVPGTVAGAITGATPLTPHDLTVFLNHLRAVDGRIAVECGDTIRALVLYASEHADTGLAHLQGLAEAGGAGRDWGLLPRSKPPQTVVRDISRVLAMTGPCVIAVDQLDSLVNLGQDETDAKVTSAELSRELSFIADGLMKLREKTRRTLSIVACLPNTWKMLHSIASDTVADRFAETPFLGSIVDPAIGRALVERWLGEVYRRAGVTPPHPTWPVAPGAFTGGWSPRTPRQLLMSVHAHAESCRYGEIRELRSFDEKPVPVLPPADDGPEPDYLQEFDARFERLRQKAEISAAGLKQHNEDEVMPALLLAGLKSWINEVGNDDLAWKAEQLHGGSEVHAQLLHTVNEDLDTDERWGFRLIASAHGNHVLRRMRKVRDAARFGTHKRRLVLIYNGGKGWTGRQTRVELAELEQAGGRRVEISDDDLRTFSALKEMSSTQTHQLLAWLVARKPASRMTFLREILPGPGRSAASHQETRPPPPGEPTTPPPGGPATPPSGDRTAPLSPTEIVLGMDGEIRIELESLRKHAIVFAGSGSGKTVLLRRIVEECALRGVSAIVLDPNNDLARLGDAWPRPPADWLPGDVGVAAEYLANVEVVVWTPGRTGGRPLSFHPLPDFAEVRGDVDEFAASVEAAVARLVPHARVGGGSKTAVRGQAVLREALTHYARKDGRDLAEFIDVLDDLPEGVSKLSTARATAADLAETLRAAMVNDPLLGGAGEPTDPAVLLTPTPGKRARISVISFVGLPSEEQKQGFVSQLQLEVFAWIKRNPAADRPLGGLVVMDEAQTIAPSGGWTASTQSTILLASQARKYGLGLLLATQAPKGVHNQIVGNATTQFFGRLNSPAQIAAATEMAKAKGSSVGDISRLERGQFYVTGETFGFRRMRTPLCLSHHPPSPLRLEDVLDRARDGRH